MTDKRPTIFIIDDVPLLSKKLTAYFMGEFPGFRIHSFTTGEECMEQMNNTPMAVVLDYQLYGKEMAAANGINMMHEIKKHNKSLPVVILCSEENYDAAEQTIMQEPVHFVIKGEDGFPEIYQWIKAHA